MTRYGKLAVAGAAVVALAVGGTTAVVVVDEEPILAGLNLQTVEVVFDADTQYLGKCAVVTPPGADPCDAVQGTIRYVFFGAAVNADVFKKWKASNPGEYARLTAHMNAPACSLLPNGQPQDMITFTGAMFYAAVQAYACAYGTEPIAWPAPNPPRAAGSQDKTPPSAPGPLTSTP